ncbi:MAG: hypothetical protein K2G24_05970 [Muribaculaceae bacterium]|nr:hypothetical protein [Muribaculaceae bacterium]
MKLSRTLALIAAALLIGLGATSCNDKNNNEEFKVQQKITTALAHVSDINGTEASITYKGLSYDIIYDYIAATAEVTIQGLRVPGGTQYPAVKLSEVPFKVEKDGTRLLEGTNLPSAISGFASAPLFTSFRLSVFDRIIGEYYYPVASISFTIDGRYHGVSTIPTQVFQGTTVTTDANGQSFSNTDPIYVLELDVQKMTASLTINGAKFVQQMPAQTMSFTEIPFTISDNGVVTIEKSGEIIPTIGNTPYPSFPITGFKAVFTIGTGMNLDFVCSVKGEPYTVNAQLPFNYKAQQQ